jgi:hypothetical protein
MLRVDRRRNVPEAFPAPISVEMAEATSQRHLSDDLDSSLTNLQSGDPLTGSIKAKVSSGSLRRQTHSVQRAGSPPVLAASEIGAFTFCPEAWILDRLGTPQNPSGENRRISGSSVHRRIGRRADRIVFLDGATKFAFVALVLLLILVVADATQIVHLPLP